MLGDWRSTVIFMGGTKALQQHLNRDDCMVIAVTQDLDVYVSPKLKERLKINADKTAYKFLL